MAPEALASEVDITREITKGQRLGQLGAENLCGSLGFFRICEDLATQVAWHSNVILFPYVVGGDLFTYCNTWRWSDPKSWMLDIVWISGSMFRGLSWLHEHEFFHRDVKPENVVLSEDGTVKLIDFGLAKEHKGLRRYGTVGTPEYLAPEVRYGREYEKSIDVFAGFLVVWELIAGVPLLYAKDRGRLETNWRSYCSGCCSANSQGKIIYDAVAERTSFEAAYNSPWATLIDHFRTQLAFATPREEAQTLEHLTDFKSSMQEVCWEGLRLDPELRSPCSSIVAGPLFADVPMPAAFPQRVERHSQSSEMRLRPRSDETSTPFTPVPLKDQPADAWVGV